MDFLSDRVHPIYSKYLTAAFGSALILLFPAAAYVAVTMARSTRCLPNGARRAACARLGECC